MNPNRVGKFIYLLRTEKEWSQYQLADMIPISRQAVSKWERGQTIPDSSTLLRLSEIFGVTINELLTGERLKDGSLKELETTTLNILDESNKKTKKIKKNLIIYSITVGLLIFLFLTYYFINSYNMIKVYTVFGESKHFRVHDGIFISTNEKSYLKIGEVKANKDVTIKKIKLYYERNGKKELVSEDVDIDRIIRDSYGYSTLFFKKGSIIKASLEITYNDTEIEQLELIFQRDFSNSNFIFEKNRKFGETITTKSQQLQQQGKSKNDEKDKDTEEKNKEDSKTEVKEEKKQDDNSKEEEKNEIEENSKPTLNEENKNQEELEPVNEMEKIEIIKAKGMYENGNYDYIIEDETFQIEFIYFPMMNQLMMYENEKIVWTYMILPKAYLCQRLYAENEDLSNPENCKNYVLETLRKYVK